MVGMSRWECAATFAPHTRWRGARGTEGGMATRQGKEDGDEGIPSQVTAKDWHGNKGGWGGRGGRRGREDWARTRKMTDCIGKDEEGQEGQLRPWPTHTGGVVKEGHRGEDTTRRRAGQEIDGVGKWEESREDQGP